MEDPQVNPTPTEPQMPDAQQPDTTGSTPAETYPQPPEARVAPAADSPTPDRADPRPAGDAPQPATAAGEAAAPQPDDDSLNFDVPKARTNGCIIKVVGVGGGGSNAVQHMYQANIQDVSFLIINTDRQALEQSPIPDRLQISDKGLGAGAKPEVARAFAEASRDKIREALSDNTEMVFITAGMGGGTGTGASPVVAEVAHDLGLLTIGIVTIPFQFEGKRKIAMALQGVEAISKHVDALLVVNNNRLINIYPDLNFFNAFSKADDTLTVAAKSISDIINIHGYINLDFADVRTTLQDGGVALISTGQASGDNRLTHAIEAAKESPLLQDNDIKNAKHLLFEICFSSAKPITMAEIKEMNDFVDKLNSEIEVIWGAMVDETLGEDVRIILLASGFTIDHETGQVISTDQKADEARETERRERSAARQRLAEAIAAAEAGVEGIGDYPEAADLLSAAIEQARTADTGTVDEIDAAITALQKAQSEAQTLANKIAKRRRIEEDERKMRAKLAALQRERDELEEPDDEPTADDEPTQPKAPQTPAQASTPTAPAQPATPQSAGQTAAPQPTPQQPATQPAAPQPTPQQPATQPAAPQPTPQQPATQPAAPQPAAQQPAARPAAPQPAAAPATAAPAPAETASASVRPATTTRDAIEQIRRYYGEEAARKAIMDEVRKAYCLLDDDELTNEQLIERLEQLPAYNRSIEDLGQLRAVRATPAKPQPLTSPAPPNPGPADGTIHF